MHSCAYPGCKRAHRRLDHISSAQCTTVLQPAIFARYLAGHPDHLFVSRVIKILLYSVNIGYEGPSQSLCTTVSASARIHKEFFRKQFTDELQQNHACEPFKNPPVPMFHHERFGDIPQTKSRLPRDPRAQPESLSMTLSTLRLSH